MAAGAVREVRERAESGFECVPEVKIDERWEQAFQVEMIHAKNGSLHSK